MEKPKQFTIVSEVPLESSGAFWATKVENKGESAITTSPQKNKKISNKIIESENKKRGEVMQHKHDENKAIVAIFLAPKCWESIPLKTHANPPDPMIRNDNKGTFRCVSG